MPTFNWSSFTTRVPVNALAEKLYWCRASKEGLEYWFLRLSEYKKPTGEI